MKKLLNSLYIMTKESYLTLDGENVVVFVEHKEKARFPLHTLEGILCFNYAGASPALMGACASKGIDLCFFTPNGKFLARTVGEERGNVLLRAKQHLISRDETESCKYARRFILGKIYNARWVLERTTRDHSLRVPVEKMKEASNKLAKVRPAVRDASDLSQLRGIEGEASGFDLI